MAGFLAAFTLVAFAANSVLCRIALGGNLIDPVSFTSIRLTGGAALLFLLSRQTTGSGQPPEARGAWGSGFALFVYAIAFSCAYVHLDTGMGALLLFGSVQVTMIGVGLISGERPHLLQWLGLVVALGALVYLISPGIAAPDPLGACLMILSGVAWGVYSLRGRGVTAPLPSTSGNFARSVPATVISAAFAVSSLFMTPAGVILALTSGTVTSGLGYVLWYRVVGGLSRTQAAIVQLLTPVLAALGGVMFLAEKLSARLAVASAVVFAGVLLASLSARRDR